MMVRIWCGRLGEGYGFARGGSRVRRIDALNGKGAQIRLTNGVESI